MKNNIFPVGIFSLFIIHLIISSYLFDSYSIDRIVMTLYIITFFTSILIFNIDMIVSNFYIKNPFVLFFLYSFALAYISPYINTPFEIAQQKFVSSSYLVLTLFFITLAGYRFTLSQYLKMITSIGVILFIFMAIASIVNDLTLMKTAIRYFNNIRVLNHTQTIVIPSLLLLLFLVKNLWVKAAVSLVIISNMFLVLELGGRGTVYSVSISYILFALTNYKNKKVLYHMLWLVGLATATFVMHVVIEYFMVAESFTEHLIEFSAIGRVHIYEVLAPHLFSSDHIINAIGFTTQDIAVSGFMHPHNMFMYIFYGTGLAGLAIFVGIILYYIRVVLAEYFNTTNIIKRYLLVILSSAFIHSMVSGFYLAPLATALFLAFILIFAKHYVKNSNKQSGKMIILTNILVVAVFSVVLATSLFNNMEYKNIYSYKGAPKEDDVQKYNPGILLYSVLYFINTQRVND